MAAAVVGDTRLDTFTFDELAASSGADAARLLATSGVGMRDETAYQLLSLGYSARADVVSGRITLHALDTARRMMAVGLGRDEAADYLDAQYR
jgi:dTDP-4-amino-4,6-dideoxygalactose transaminase